MHEHQEASVSWRSEFGKINRGHTFYLGWFGGALVGNLTANLEPADPVVLKLTILAGGVLAVAWTLVWAVLVARR